MSKRPPKPLTCCDETSIFTKEQFRYLQKRSLSQPRAGCRSAPLREDHPFVDALKQVKVTRCRWRRLFMPWRK